MPSALNALFIPIVLTLAFLVIKFLSRDRYGFKVERFNLNTKVKLYSADSRGMRRRWYGIIGLKSRQMSRIREVTDLGDMVLISDERIIYDSKDNKIVTTKNSLKDVLSNYPRNEVNRFLIKQSSNGATLSSPSKEYLCSKVRELPVGVIAMSIEESIFIINNNAYIFSGYYKEIINPSVSKFNEDTVDFILKTLREGI